jgi:hypothetical protein
MNKSLGKIFFFFEQPKNLFPQFAHMEKISKLLDNLIKFCAKQSIQMIHHETRNTSSTLPSKIKRVPAAKMFKTLTALIFLALFSHGIRLKCYCRGAMGCGNTAKIVEGCLVNIILINKKMLDVCLVLWPTGNWICHISGLYAR